MVDKGKETRAGIDYKYRTAFLSSCYRAIFRHTDRLKVDDELQSIVLRCGPESIVGFGHLRELVRVRHQSGGLELSRVNKLDEHRRSRSIHETCRDS